MVDFWAMRNRWTNNLFLVFLFFIFHFFCRTINSFHLWIISLWIWNNEKATCQCDSAITYSQYIYIYIWFFRPVCMHSDVMSCLRIPLYCRRYYYSLFLELSDISMPLVRAVIDKVSKALSFFLVCLIGRSLGLIYTGIRQSLRWKW